jgi:ABC-type branched-subunit amino acid transport system ATPase component
MLLSVKNITVHYAKARALDGVSLTVDEGAVVSIIGVLWGKALFAGPVRLEAIDFRRN